MIEEFKELFEYTHYFNKKVIELISENKQKSSEKAIKLLNHTINANQIWNARIINESQFEVWQINNWDDLLKLNDDNYSNTLKILNNFDIYAEIDYKNSKGETFSNIIKDILFHIINHSTYHRAQIATELKQNGVKPIISDYIFYKRKME